MNAYRLGIWMSPPGGRGDEGHNVVHIYAPTMPLARAVRYAVLSILEFQRDYSRTNQDMVFADEGPEPRAGWPKDHIPTQAIDEFRRKGYVIILHPPLPEWLNQNMLAWSLNQ